MKHDLSQVYSAAKVEIKMRALRLYVFYLSCLFQCFLLQSLLILHNLNFSYACFYVLLHKPVYGAVTSCLRGNCLDDCNEACQLIKCNHISENYCFLAQQYFNHYRNVLVKINMEVLQKKLCKYFLALSKLTL